MSFTAGQVLSPLVKPAITVEQLCEYAEAASDHNPIHLNPTFAKEAGFPSVIAHGMLSMAFLGDFVLSHFPENQYRVLRMKTRFRKVTFPGEVLTCEGKVKEIQPNGSLVLSVSTRNAVGEATADGEAVVSPR